MPLPCGAGLAGPEFNDADGRTGEVDASAVPLFADTGFDRGGAHKLITVPTSSTPASVKIPVMAQLSHG